MDAASALAGGGVALKSGSSTLLPGSSVSTRRRVSSGGKNPGMQVQCASTYDSSMAPASPGADDKATTTPSLREVPGSYGLPFFGAIKDRLDFHWFQGMPKFYTDRRDKYKSTVFRTNVPPGPPFYGDPRVVVVLDEKSYPILFDVDKVEKKDVFTGTYVPSLKLTGGYRVVPYLDPSEPKHKLLKQLAFDICRLSGSRLLPELIQGTTALFTKLEATVKKDGKAAFSSDLNTTTFKFMMKSYTGRDPFEAGPNTLKSNIGSLLWIFAQIGPISVVPAPWFLAPLIELFLHTFRIPAWPFQWPYKDLLNYFRAYGTELLDIAEKELKLDREEALHNLLFICIFNAWGGVMLFFPKLLARLAATSVEFQKELSAEVRAAVKGHGGEIGFKALADMPLVDSAVYEALRIEPPVPYQYATAKEDLVIQSWDASFQIKKGEVIHGYQPVATKDPEIFDDPESFLPKRFMGEEGKKLLKYVLWSNGQQTEEPTTGNKHCPGKDYIPLITKAFVATIYSQYETLQIDKDNKLTTLTPVSSH